MKRIIAALLLCTFLLSACGSKGSTGMNASDGRTGAAENTQTGSEATPAADKVSDYFPFTADIHMMYKGTGNEYAAYDTYVDYIRDNVMQVRSNNGGTEAVTVYEIRDGALISKYSRGETYYRYDYTAMPGSEDILLKEPLAAGTTWTSKDGSERSITAVNMQIETPAGKFNAIEVTTKLKDATDKDYYAKGVGLVKTEYSSGDASMKVTSELEKVEKDAAFKHTVKFYFPQFEKDRVVYIEREISLKTNEDVLSRFQEELKKKPETGGLSRTLTQNTKVLGLKLDDSSDVVTVDISSDFTREMNAGASFESMLVDSITNTFGDYYMKGRTAILLDGKPYESGHIMLKKGESFEVRKDGTVQYK